MLLITLNLSHANWGLIQNYHDVLSSSSELTFITYKTHQGENGIENTYSKGFCGNFVAVSNTI